MKNAFPGNGMENFGTVRAGEKLDGSVPASLSDILSGLVSQFGIGRKREEDELETFWREFAGELAEYSSVDTVRRGRLEITVSDAIFMQELMFRKAELIQKLNEHFSDQNFEDIRFRVGNIRERYGE
ncbi:MAG: DUF721 domain-containing protein [Planctomycetia bacterium]|nr:DUF721 domain-containing protein [Planctomycetia bacterium]